VDLIAVGAKFAGSLKHTSLNQCTPVTPVDQWQGMNRNTTNGSGVLTRRYEMRFVARLLQRLQLLVNNPWIRR
jgi:hypothetical protein